MSDDNRECRRLCELAVLSGIAGFIVSIAFNMGLMECYPLKKIRSEACDHGFAEYVTDENGNPKFVWKDSKAEKDVVK